MLGQNDSNQRKTYLTISHGKVVQGSGERKQYFSFVEGTIQAIYVRRATFGNEIVTRWYIDIRDKAEIYSLCLPYSSGVFKSIILSLASVTSLTAFTPVRIEPYEANGYTKVVVYANGVKLNWITAKLPPKEVVTIGGSQIKDDTKQMQFISTLCNEITERINKTCQK